MLNGEEELSSLFYIKICLIHDKIYSTKGNGRLYRWIKIIQVKVKPNPNNLVKIRLFELMVQYVQTNKENENNEILEIVKCRSNESE